MTSDEQESSQPTESLRRKAPEIGTLWADRNGGSRFVGSASGVFFLRTVQNAFSNATSRLRKADNGVTNGSNNPSQAQLSPEYFFASEDEPTPRPTITTVQSDRGRDHQSHESWTFLHPPPQLPSYEVVKQLTKVYFQRWHPIAPFLHGPMFFREMELQFASDVSVRNQFTLSQTVLIHCICNIALLDAPNLQPLPELNSCSAEKLLPALGLLAINDSLQSIQALLSAQLFFLATLSFRSASITGGLTMRAIMKAGLHRCPFRYPELSTLDREMRKRVFWSAYILDRFLSQALGQPLGIQDSDIDVCLPGPTDLHSPVSSTAKISPESSVDLAVHLPRGHPDHLSSISGHPNNIDGHQLSEQAGNSVISTGQSSPRIEATIKSTLSTPRRGKSIFPEMVAASRLVGRTLETFHVSIHARSASPQNVLALKADLEAWGNNSASQFNWNTSDDSISENHGSTGATSIDATHSTFLVISYYQLVLLVNRPHLALEQRSAEFKLALQTCVTAAKSILQTLRTFVKKGHQIFWPGHLLAVWMSGLVIAFAGRLKAYDTDKAVVGLNHSIELLKTVSTRWLRAEACIAVLAELLANVKPDQQPSLRPDLIQSSHPVSKKRKQNDSGLTDEQSQRRASAPRESTAIRDHEVGKESFHSDPVYNGGTSAHYQFDYTLQQRDSTNQALMRPPSEQMAPYRVDHNRRSGSIYQPMPALASQIPEPWSRFEQYTPTGTMNILPDEAMHFSGFNGEDPWSNNFDSDFMVWDSLQQLITNNN